MIQKVNWHSGSLPHFNQENCTVTLHTIIWSIGHYLLEVISNVLALMHFMNTFGIIMFTKFSDLNLLVTQMAFHPNQFPQGSCTLQGWFTCLPSMNFTTICIVIIKLTSSSGLLWPLLISNEHRSPPVSASILYPQSGCTHQD